MSGEADRDPLEQILIISRRRAWKLGAVFGGLFLGGLIAIATLVSPPSPGDLSPWLEAGAIAFGAIGLLQLVLFRGDKRTVRRLRPLGPLVADAGRPMTRGIMLILHDGLVMTFAGNAVTCTLFFGADGAVFHPGLEQAVRWTSPWFMSQLGAVTKRSGPPEARVELEALGTGIGAATSICIVRQQRAPAPDPTAPRWMAMTAFVSMMNPFMNPFSPFLYLEVEPIIQRLPTIEAFLRRALGLFAPMARAVPSRQSSWPLSPESVPESQHLWKSSNTRAQNGRVPAEPLPVHPSSPIIDGALRAPVRMLGWGLVLSLVLSVLSLLASVGRVLAPNPTSVPFASMPPEVLVANCAILLLPVAAFGLVLFGLSRMRTSSPEVAGRLTWRLGALVFSPASAFGAFGAAVVVSSLLASVGGAAGLFGAVAFSASLGFAVWFFAYSAAAALAVPATRAEQSVLRFVVVETFFFACLAAGAGAAATALNAPALLSNSAAEVPPFVPWTDLPGAMGISVGLAVLVAISFRVSRRLRSSDLPAATPVS